MCVTGPWWVRADCSGEGSAAVCAEADAARAPASAPAPALESLAIQMVKNRAARTTRPTTLHRGVSAIVRIPFVVLHIPV